MIAPLAKIVLPTCFTYNYSFFFVDLSTLVLV